MPDTGAPPPIPTEFRIYNSYQEDPKWQRRFTVAWVSFVGVAIILSLPHLVRSIRNRSAFTGFFGVWEDFSRRNYAPAPAPASSEPSEEGVEAAAAGGKLESPNSHTSKFTRCWQWFSKVGSLRLWSLPGIGLNAGQVGIILAYIVLVLVCIILNAPLSSNANRPGFIALAQLPVVFLFATKNSLLSLLLLGPGSSSSYEKLNYIHRWSGRCMFLGAVLHGTLWIQNHLTWHLPILGQQKETSGVAALALLCLIVLTSLKPVRRYFYQTFFVVHVLAFVAFFVTICYHTIYASPWIFPPLAFYGLDMLMRMVRCRIKDATLTPIDQQMTIIRVMDCDGGWQAGQHVRLRVFFSGRFFESHPLTIMRAPMASSCVSFSSSSSADTAVTALVLGARVNGDWTRALNGYARSEMERVRSEVGLREGSKLESREGEMEKVGVEREREREKEQEKEKDKEKDKEEEEEEEEEKDKEEEEEEEGSNADADADSDLDPCMGVPIQVMLDGPYGGCGIDLGRYESVLLVAGGSGATFTLGLLDDIVARCGKLGRPGGEVTRRIEFAWCTRSFGSIRWFAPFLVDIANVAAAAAAPSLDLHISIFVTCLCDPEAVAHIPNCDISLSRPSVYTLLVDLVSLAVVGPRAATSSSSSSSSVDIERGSSSLDGAEAGGPRQAAGRPSPTMRKGDGGGGGVGVCASGPESMTREAQNAVARLGMARGVELGGIGIHVEPFTL